MSVYQFGSGVMWAIPTINLAGGAVANPTPVPFGVLQDVSIDISFNKKELHGQFQYPLAVARATAKLTAKAKAARITAALFNQVFGETLSTGEIKTAFQESGTIPASPYQVTAANSATWTLDLGVSYAATGLPLTRVASAPTTGQYSVAAGVYTFAAADTTLGVKISYLYTTAIAPGQVFTINNQLLGASPFFQANFSQVYQGKHLTVQFNRCTADKLSLATKLEDWTIPEFDFSMMADDAGVVGKISVSE